MQKRENYLLFLFAGTLFLFHTILIVSNNGAYGGADNIGHFRIARYAFNYPNLFFDHWGKPVFTAFFAPIAQLGFKATQLLNVFLGLIAIFVAFDIGRLGRIKFNPALFFLVAFSPMYFLLMQSCLTEVLLSLFLLMAIWLFMKDRFYLAAILLSFIPFVRTEGIVVFPLFAAAFLWHKKYLTLPLLLTGSLFYTLAGFPFYKDLLWIVHQMPYSMGKSVYGSGELLHFVKNGDEIFGLSFKILLLFGLLVWAWQVLRKFNLNNKNLWLFVLVAGSFSAYFAAHSYVWWKGTGGSLGLIRVIAGVIPLAGLTAIVGLNQIFDKIKSKYINWLVIGIISGWQLVGLFNAYPVPFTWERPQQLMAEAASYIKATEHGEIYYFDPFLLHFLEMDPYDQKLNNMGVSDKNQPSNSLNMNDILVWDAHFGPNENNVSLLNLMKDPFLQFEKSILPVEPFKVLGGHDYGIYIFRKVPQKSSIESKQLVEKAMIFRELENIVTAEFEGISGLKLDNSTEFSQALQFSFGEIKAESYAEIIASISFFPTEIFQPDDVLLILSVESSGKSVSYNKNDLETSQKGINKWISADLIIKLPASIPGDAIVNLYVWNKSKKNLAVEKLTLTGKGY